MLKVTQGCFQDLLKSLSDFLFTLCTTNLGQGQNCKVEGGGNDLLYDLSLTNTCQIENQRTHCALV